MKIAIYSKALSKLSISATNFKKMHRVKKRTTQENTAAWGVFKEVKGKKKFYNFSEVRSEIERLSDTVAGENKGIVNIPIS